LFFRVDDFDMALNRARALGIAFEEEPHVNAIRERGSFHSGIRTDITSLSVSWMSLRIRHEAEHRTGYRCGSCLVVRAFVSSWQSDEICRG
jgi:hypothetical protein